MTDVRTDPGIANFTIPIRASQNRAVAVRRFRATATTAKRSAKKRVEAHRCAARAVIIVVAFPFPRAP